MKNCSDNYNLHINEETQLIYLCVDRENADKLRQQAEIIAEEKRKVNGGWVVVKRIFNTFYALDIDGNFLNEITYYKI